jgi:hypothetical protein
MVLPNLCSASDYPDFENIRFSAKDFEKPPSIGSVSVTYAPLYKKIIFGPQQCKVTQKE